MGQRVPERYFLDPRYRHKGSSNPKRNRLYLWGAVGIAVLLGLLYMGYLISGLPSLKELENPESALASEVISVDGQVIATYYHENRTPVPLDSIAPAVIHALIATEDQRFYRHWGVNIWRTAQAALFTLLGNRQGGSTITQQLARNLYETVGKEVSIERKIREMLTAIQIERAYTKREILEMYLNTVDFGNNAFGIASAARVYFSKRPSELEPDEAALLIGLLKGTSYYNPVRHPERARMRRDLVLTQMHRNGYLSWPEYERYRQRPIALRYTPPSHTSGPYAHFAEYVRLQVRQWASKRGYNIYRDGLRIYTTLDTRMQRYAQRAVDSLLAMAQPALERQWGGPGLPLLWRTHPELLPSLIRQTEAYREALRDGQRPERALDSLLRLPRFVDSVKTYYTTLQAGFVALDPSNGHIKVWIGSKNYALDTYDHVYLARRQPGSTFKPFVYVAAIDNGYSPQYVYPNAPITFYNPDGTVRWQPRNAEGESSGEATTLRQALAHSYNMVTARLVADIGEERVAEYARRLGISSPLDVVPALALGTSDVTLLELTAAYATFANRGIYTKPLAILRIEDARGRILEEFQPERREALSEQTAYIMVDMMRDVINYGTGVRLRVSPPYGFGLTDLDLAGKTGTTQQHADAWFVAMTPNLVAGAWVGCNDRRVAFRDMSWGQGARLALPIVGRFLRYVYRDPEIGLPREVFTPPEHFTPPEDYGYAVDSVRSAALPPSGPSRPPSIPGRERRRVDW
ncbi:MAG: PBP1A family penicillin-binding protein [Bacteroidetes bacterium]|nr:PBP1A family penicillin-binding protein [Bacteroidota bacterium]MCX7906925.1 PBP1A family penicillin-binding protein [Bacteroidota bacterium]MDW8137711.1 PBP1A family penicillin-binding protein [Bacteroidota bacterium]